MATKIRLTDAGNVLVPAYLALKQKGYTVRWTRQEDNPEEETWYAEDANRQFVASDPVTLLGLVSIYETRGDNWQASDEEIELFVSNY